MRVAVFLIVVQIATCLGLKPALRLFVTNNNAVLTRTTTNAAAVLTRTCLAGLLGLVGLCTPTDVSAALAPSSWDKEILVETLVAPKADAKVPKVGDMVAVRFKASFNGNTFDDTFKSDQPYFYRTGVGLILKGTHPLTLLAVAVGAAVRE